MKNKTKNKKTTKKVDKKKIKKESRFKTYIKGVRSELAKVKFPTKKEMIEYTVATLVFIIFFALFFLLIEVIFAWLKTV